jgi:hypothetical protein
MERDLQAVRESESGGVQYFRVVNTDPIVTRQQIAQISNILFPAFPNRSGQV